MRRRPAVDLRDQKPILDVVSLGRHGIDRRDRLVVGQMARTVRGAPEVVIKVSGGARTLRGFASHLDYIGRKGDLEIETDDGKRIREEGFEKKLIEDWDLDLESYRERMRWYATYGRSCSLDGRRWGNIWRTAGISTWRRGSTFRQGNAATANRA
jgi:hypothetical protein